MYYSKLLIPTLKNSPADAEVIHQDTDTGLQVATPGALMKYKVRIYPATMLV